MAVLRKAHELRCMSCGFKRTQLLPMPDKCPRCSAPLNSAGTQLQVNGHDHDDGSCVNCANSPFGACEWHARIQE